MAISGLVASGMQDALADVLDRRLKEEIRLQQEKQAAADLDLRRQSAAALETERAADREFRTGQVARQDAETAIGRATPGPISPADAATIRKSPAHAGSITDRKVIEGVRPIAGAMGEMDMSGPQSFPVLEPTKAQADQQRKTVMLQQIGKTLSGASNEGQRRGVAAEALGAGIEVPSALFAPTQAEKAAETAAAEARERTEWDRRTGVTEANIRNRPIKVSTELTPAQRLTNTRMLRNDFLRETDAAREMQAQHGLMRESLGVIKKTGDLAQGSQGILVTFQKILDPTSVVRESEYARSASGLSAVEQIKGFYQKLSAGGAGVSVEELEKFVNLAQRFVEARAREANESKSQIDSIADEYGLDKKQITRSFGEEAAPAPAPGAAPAAGGGKSAYQLYQERQQKPK